MEGEELTVEDGKIRQIQCGRAVRKSLGGE